MSDQGKPEHPAPWRWVPGSSSRKDPLAANWLADANGVILVSPDVDEEIEIASPVVSELIRLAPEMEALLRRAVDLLDTLGGGGSPVAIESAALLAAIDAARKATP